jgi:hypothetical protein
MPAPVRRSVSSPGPVAEQIRHYARVEMTPVVEPRTVGCFIRVDISVPGEHSPAVYDALSERLQDLLQEAIVEQADGGPELDLQAMTCVVLGPLRTDECIGETFPPVGHFRPVVEWLASGGDSA